MLQPLSDCCDLPGCKNHFGRLAAMRSLSACGQVGSVNRGDGKNRLGEDVLGCQLAAEPGRGTHSAPVVPVLMRPRQTKARRLAHASDEEGGGHQARHQVDWSGET
jgi:hypothetical protein